MSGNAATYRPVMERVNPDASALSTAQLRAQLGRLECRVRQCGRHGLIFMPQQSGGLRIEGNELHLWDGEVHVYRPLGWVGRRLASLPDGAGYEKVRHALRENPAPAPHGEAFASPAKFKALLGSLGVLPILEEE